MLGRRLVLLCFLPIYGIMRLEATLPLRLGRRSLLLLVLILMLLFHRLNDRGLMLIPLLALWCRLCPWPLRLLLRFHCLLRLLRLRLLHPLLLLLLIRYRWVLPLLLLLT